MLQWKKRKNGRWLRGRDPAVSRPHHIDMVKGPDGWLLCASASLELGDPPGVMELEGFVEDYHRAKDVVAVEMLDQLLKLARDKEVVEELSMLQPDDSSEPVVLPFPME